QIWIEVGYNGVKDRQKPEYIAGVNEFLHFAFTGKNDGTMLKCPCLNCRLVLSQNRKNMHCHLLVYGIDPTYNPWVSHGESIQETDIYKEGYIEEVSDNESDEMPHKGSGWEPNAEKDYEALKRLHEKEIEKHGEDTLSVKDAYMEVFKQKSGYVKGLGPGARPLKKCRAEGESNEASVSLSSEIQKLKDAAAAREASLASEIETLKASNEELIASNDELKATISRINIEAIKREKKLRDDIVKIFEQM
ncbi:Cortexillin-1, partial [Bienertia sinuspersici]